MIAVIFEVTPHKAHYDEYLAIAGELLPILQDMDGFISIERFSSLTTPGKVLSLSFWRRPSRSMPKDGQKNICPSQFQSHPQVR
ncbi:antibiotic biosynthesis monooxygenase family protein [Thalassospira lucentensis]|uniref:Antibiotic biosynthesis monooxygenase n=1 Tax=Thalassospira lucentensis TaxID=168935 RepID=A0A3D5N7K5_9PROT|nr:antibiotic biosynthesis monooxygenase family protein [Thalassospira lucentensis]HCW67070.1 antibiotic biosynthesis monooxygenase [Thalassospira lucentensis]